MIDAKVKQLANRLATAAFERGEILKENCTICGLPEDVIMHHEDYDKPLAITWMCWSCHSILHSKRGDRSLDKHKGFRTLFTLRFFRENYHSIIASQRFCRRNTVARILHRSRVYQKLDVFDLAKMARIDFWKIYNIERGYAVPSRTINVVAKALGIELEDLVNSERTGKALKTTVEALR